MESLAQQAQHVPDSQAAPYSKNILEQVKLPKTMTTY